MPRGGRSGASRSRSPTRSTTTFSQAPKKTATPITQQPATSGGLFSGLGSMFFAGIGLGAGSEIGHQVVRGVTGGSRETQSEAPPETKTQSAPKTNYCQSENDKFISCLKTNTDSISFCQPFIDQLKDCEKNYS